LPLEREREKREGKTLKSWAAFDTVGRVLPDSLAGLEKFLEYSMFVHSPEWFSLAASCFYIKAFIRTDAQHFLVTGKLF
jgi:hypothetical protein